MTEAAARILVVDEEEWIRELLVGMLGVLGYQATSASSVEDGRQKFTAGHFRCVICGSSIISGAGGDFLHHLKNYRRQTRILLVKEPGPAGAAELQTECVDYVLSKPFRIDDLRLALEAPVAPLSG
jgi:DNA-binding NtrC family response regulator